MKTPTSSQSDSAVPASRLAGKGKSALRPSGSTSKSAKKAALRRRQSVSDSDPEFASQHEDSDVDMQDDRGSSVGSLKRPAADQWGGKSKKLKGSGAPPTPDSDLGTDPPKLPLRYEKPLPPEFLTAPKSANQTLSRTRRTAPLTSARPQKPVLPRQPPEYVAALTTSTLPDYEFVDGVWRCKHDGCIHKVYDPESADAKRLIKEHYRAHAYAAQEELDAQPLNPAAQAYMQTLEKEREKRREPRLKTENLERRIRMMSAARLAASGTPQVQSAGQADQPSANGATIQAENEAMEVDPPAPVTKTPRRLRRWY